MKSLLLVVGITIILSAGCKSEKEKGENPKATVLTAEQIEKAFEFADSSSIVGEPQHSSVNIWDTATKQPLTLHQTSSLVELLVPVNDKGQPVKVDSTMARKIIVRTPVYTMVVCSFSCQMRPGGTGFCQNASGCSYNRALKECSAPDCGGDCTLSRPCKLEKTYGMSMGVIMW
jgi:hypothetical protein